MQTSERFALPEHNYQFVSSQLLVSLVQILLWLMTFSVSCVYGILQLADPPIRETYRMSLEKNFEGRTVKEPEHFKGKERVAAVFVIMLAFVMYLILRGCRNGLRAGRPGFLFRKGQKILLHSVQAGSRAHPPSYPKVYLKTDKRSLKPLLI